MNDNKIVKDFECYDGLNIELVIETYNNYIYTIIKNAITNQEDIEEILSDVFTIFWKNYNANKIAKDDKVKAYLIGIAKNLIKQKYRNYNTENIMENIDNIEIVDNYDISKIVEDNEKSRLIIELQENMKDIERKIFIMFYYQNKKIKYIAKNLNITQTRVKVTLYRLRKLAKKKFKENGYDYGK